MTKPNDRIVIDDNGAYDIVNRLFASDLDCWEAIRIFDPESIVFQLLTLRITPTECVNINMFPDHSGLINKMLGRADIQRSIRLAAQQVRAGLSPQTVEIFPESVVPGTVMCSIGNYIRR